MPTVGGRVGAVSSNRPISFTYSSQARRPSTAPTCLPSLEHDERRPASEPVSRLQLPRGLGQEDADAKAAGERAHELGHDHGDVERLPDAQRVFGEHEHRVPGAFDEGVDALGPHLGAPMPGEKLCDQRMDR